MSGTPESAIPQPAPGTPGALKVLPPERMLRGVLLSLLIIPAGVIAWIVIWRIGFIVGFVGIGVAVGALALYRIGSGGRIGLKAAVIVSVITILTLAAAFIGGVVADDPLYFRRALGNGTFFAGVGAAINRYGSDIIVNVLLLVVFAGLGVFTIFRTAFVQRRELRNENVIVEPHA